MGRSRDRGFLNDLFNLAAKIPWWVGVALAAVCFGAMHLLAQMMISPVAGGAQGGGMIVRHFIHAVASVMQYIVPAICLAGAVASVIGRLKREGLISSATQGGRAAVLAMSWQDFELLIGESFRQAGYDVVETGGGGADGGVDLILKKGGERFLVQCKQWRALKVSVSVVRELYGVMTDQGAAGGFVVTSGRFTDDASSFAKGKNIDLIDGDALAAILEQVQRLRVPIPEVKSDPVPTCPLCRSSMVRRTAKRGASAGKDFWGCSEYPDCKGTREIS